jgi:hypothetical protein
VWGGRDGLPHIFFTFFGILFGSLKNLYIFNNNNIIIIVAHYLLKLFTNSNKPF